LDSDAVLASATVVLAVGTVVLAVATLAYALAARATVDEMRISRAESIRPVLALTPEVLGPNFAIARLSNIGVGAARNIQGSIRRSEEGIPPREHELRIAMLLPTAQREFFLDINEEERHAAQTAQDMAARGRTFSVDLIYEDPLGRGYRLISEVGWSDIVEHLFPVDARLPQDLPSDALGELTKLREAVERIAKT
jgi:hypothetical protein